MIGTFNDFIGTWTNILPKDYCDMLIEYFETNQEIQNNLIKSKIYSSGKSLPFGRNDQAYVLNHHNEHYRFVYECLGRAFNEYISEYQQLLEIPMSPSEIKMQKTSPGGAFHSWHYENAGYDVAHRELVWMFYLNDMPLGEAETEFLYQKVRINPTAGTLVMWPAGMTHVHRGNTVFTHNKYILTGWFIKTPTL